MINLGGLTKHHVKTCVVQHALEGVSSLLIWQLDMVICKVHTREPSTRVTKTSSQEIS